jgi:hypothetical protein
MKQTLNILVLLLLCLPTFMNGQSNNVKEQCGTDFTPEMEARLLQNIATAKRLNLPSVSRTTTYVPVKVHLVGNNDGTQRADKNRVFTALCALNQRYADQDMVFYLAGIYDLNNTILNNHSNVSAAQFQMSLRKNQHNNAINIFVCKALNTGSSQGTTLGYYSPTYDIIAMRANQMNTTSTTLTHEMGHFFSLPHPFNGWEGSDYSTANNPSGAPYGPGNLPPASIGGELVELVDGSNCSTAADYFCDTDPDYNLGFGWNGCNYTGGAVDPTGTIVNPDESLYMGYFNDNCTNKFTGEQQGAIAADAQTFQRNYLFVSSPASTTEITTAATLVSPGNGATTPYHDEVYLNWDDVPGANQYFVQIARNSSFSLIIEEVLVTNSIYTSNILSAGINYYWRVKAFNEVSVCNNFSASRQFTTSSFTVNTKEALTSTAIKLQPNFTSEGQIVNLNIQTDAKIDATIRIVNVAGQVMKSIDNVTFQAGTHVHEIETQGLTPGVYIVNLQTANNQINERLIITD